MDPAIVPGMKKGLKRNKGPLSIVFVNVFSSAILKS
jgi:hypothetical protein